eukprot:3973915-Pyramimonas_sp.AAC.1
MWQMSSNIRIHGFACARTLHSITASQMDAGPSRTGAPLQMRGFVRAVASSRGWRGSLCCPFALQKAV